MMRSILLLAVLFTSAALWAEEAVEISEDQYHVKLQASLAALSRKEKLSADEYITIIRLLNTRYIMNAELENNEIRLADSFSSEHIKHAIGVLEMTPFFDGGGLYSAKHDLQYGGSTALLKPQHSFQVQRKDQTNKADKSFDHRRRIAPQIIFKPDFVEPEFLVTEKRKMTVAIKVEVTNTGAIGDIKEWGRSDERFTAAVRAWTKQWICTPCVEDGQPVRSAFSAPFKIDHIDSQRVSVCSGAGCAVEISEDEYHDKLRVSLAALSRKEKLSADEYITIIRLLNTRFIMYVELEDDERNLAYSFWGEHSKYAIKVLEMKPFFDGRGLYSTKHDLQYGGNTALLKPQHSFRIKGDLVREDKSRFLDYFIMQKLAFEPEFVEPDFLQNRETKTGSPLLLKADLHRNH
ncbi:MAG: hypothetical protein IPP19_08770 [Verrucomicrobia bacterium]|nr:hypothetical protein [Verrucomicrobiota bacterium]